MPLTQEGQKVMANMVKEYGPEKAKSIFYATANKRKKTSKWHLSNKKSGKKY